MNASDIHDIAVRWTIRMDRGDLTDAERAEMEQWLDADPRHRGAFVRAQVAWTHLDRSKALGGAHLLPPLPQGRRSAVRTRRALLLGGLGVAAAAGIAAVALWPSSTIYRTGPGEIRRIVLSDGSVAVMNGNSELKVTMRRSSRQLKLSGSEAWFHVAHDEGRPFLVETPTVVARAVGTAFSVVLSPSGVSVLTTEGTVAVKPVGAEDREVRVPAGTKALLLKGRAMQLGRPGIEALNRQLAWRTSQIALEDQSLREAATQFNRYNSRKIVIESADIADARVVGWFKLDDPDAFARAVASTLGARVASEQDEIRIYKQDRPGLE